VAEAFFSGTASGARFRKSNTILQSSYLPRPQPNRPQPRLSETRSKAEKFN
jgi:hypothetical protein